MSGRRRRLAILGSHPIPYRLPLYRHLARQPDLEACVFYGDDYGLTPRASFWGMDDFVWNADFLSGYRHVFLRNIAPRPDPSTFWGKLNPGLLPALVRFEPDALLVSGYAGIYALQGHLARDLLRTKLLFTCDTNVLGDPSGLRGAVRRQILRGIYRRVHGFLVSGTRNLEHYLSVGVDARRCFWFPWAVNNTDLQAQSRELTAAREQIRRTWGIPSRAFCFVCVSRLIPLKRIDDVIRAVSKIPEAHLLVVGSGPEQASLTALAEELIPERVTFAGFLNVDRVPEAYVAADALVLASDWEAWGLVCNEALNFGIPVVASNMVGAGTDLIADGKTGCTYQVGDFCAMVDSMKRVIEFTRRAPDLVARACLERIDKFSTEEQVRGVRAALGMSPSFHEDTARSCLP